MMTVYIYCELSKQTQIVLRFLKRIERGFYGLSGYKRIIIERI